MRLRAIIEEVVLDGIRLVTEAQHEIAMSVAAVAVHYVPKDRLVADRNHRLRDRFRIFAHACAEATAEQDDLHGASCSLMVGRSPGVTIAGSGIGTINLPPQSEMWLSWAMISRLRFQGRIKT